jgi:hypothetical protein
MKSSLSIKEGYIVEDGKRKAAVIKGCMCFMSARTASRFVPVFLNFLALEPVRINRRPPIKYIYPAKVRA